MFTTIVAAAGALIVRDVLLLLRRPSRVVATLLTPALLWGFFAGGFADTVAASGEGASRSYTVSLSAGAAVLAGRRRR